MLNPGYHQVKQDLKHACKNVFPRPFNLTQKIRVRTYQRIFRLTDHQRWQDKWHSTELIKDLNEQALGWDHPRSLFDRAIEFLSAHQFAIPGYTVLQDLVGEVVRANDTISVSCFTIK